MEMDTSLRIVAIIVLILLSAYFSIAEIALAASQKTRLEHMYENGDERAKLVLDLQEKPGPFFSMIQIGLNAIAILGGVAGDTLLSPAFEAFFRLFTDSNAVTTWAFLSSFFIITMIFVLFADLIPKRIALCAPEKISVMFIRSVLFLIFLIKPIAWGLTELSNIIMTFCGVPTVAPQNITNEDILATIEAGTRAGLIDRSEKSVIENVMGMEDRTVTTAMTSRDFCVFFTLDDSAETIRRKIEDNPHSRFLVCDKNIDNVIGYVDAKNVLTRMINQEKFSLVDKSLIRAVPAVPDTLSLSELLDVYKKAGDDFAIVVNEYALTLGLITLNDVMSTVMGDLVPTVEDEPLIVKRDNDTWLIDGSAPILDVGKELSINEWPKEGMYETLAGFMLILLRKVPKVTDKVIYENYSFEVIDVERNRIDQILVTKLREADGASEEKES